jgi:hypothetical protein
VSQQLHPTQLDHQRSCFDVIIVVAMLSQIDNAFNLAGELTNQTLILTILREENRFADRNLAEPMHSSQSKASSGSPPFVPYERLH